MPQQFFEMSPKDVAQADCIIIMGTSLAVKPFSECCSAMRVDNASVTGWLVQANCRREWDRSCRVC